MITINKNTYSILKLTLIDSAVLTKNGEPIWLIPDEDVEDVRLILSYAGAAKNYLEGDEKKVDILTGTKENKDSLS